MTSDATLDLSQSTVSGFTVFSTNSHGTTFTVRDLGTAFQIAGGPGNDTLIAKGFTFTADQRKSIFATSSIETIVDPSGTYTPTTPIVIEAFGSTSLVQVGSSYFLYPVGGSSGPLLKYADGATPVVAGQTGNWVPIGAEQTASGYEIAWKLAGADQYTVWDTDSNGTNASSPIGVVSGSSAALEGLELSFRQDLNGDGVIGTVIEAYGSTRLVQVGSYYFLDPAGGSSGPLLKYADGTTPVTAGQTGGWVLLGAEQTASGYEIAWKLTGADQYTVWNTDVSGKNVSSPIGVVSGSSAALEAIESSFNQDLNGDGVIGVVTPTVIEARGATSLVQVGSYYFLYPVGGSSGPMLKYANGTPVVAGQTGNWVPLGAEQTATGYQVAWKLAGADQYTVWNTDASGGNVSSPIGIVSGSSAALKDLETSFNQDLNDDGVIGTVVTSFTLTPGVDTFVGGAGDSTVYGTTATLNAGDSLTGGSGTNVLDLIGSGYFDVTQLAKFIGFQRIEFNNPTNGSASLNISGQPIEVDASGNTYINVCSPSDWNSHDVITGDASHNWISTYLSFASNSPGAVTYDLTSATLSRVIIYTGPYVTLLINNSDTAGVSSFYGSNRAQLVTSDAMLDLSETQVGAFTVISANTQGTTFKVGDLGTAFQIAGGPGNDTLIAEGFTFTTDQRTAIFATNSVETIVDPSGTYTQPPLPPGGFMLTTGADTFVGGAGDRTVYGTTATLNAGDSLTGGSGTNVLDLIGSGYFDVTQLAKFIGFQRIEFNNPTNGSASLNINGQPIEVDASGNTYINVYSPSDWNSHDVITGDASHNWISTYLSFASNSPGAVTYDLTSATLSRVIIYTGPYVTLLINNSDTAGVSSFYGSNGAQLVTSDAMLDLSATQVGAFTVISTNTQGTTFKVGDLGTAFQIAGGPGNDTLIAQGFTFTADQRTAIFATNSVETIIDPSGTYKASPPVTVLEAYGSTSLVQVGNNYFLHPVGGSSGPLLKYADGTTPVVAGQTGNWMPLAAEQTAGGYEVAWKLADADQYTVWDTNSNGTNASSPIGIVSGSSTALEALEPSFQQDLNSDGLIGSPVIGAGQTLQVASAYSGQALFTSNTGILELLKSSSFTGTVAGMTGNDAIDFDAIDPTKVQAPTYSGDASGGTLTVTDGSHTARVALLGNYLASTFVTSSDGHGGTSVVDPPVPPASNGLTLAPNQH